MIALVVSEIVLLLQFVSPFFSHHESDSGNFMIPIQFKICLVWQDLILFHETNWVWCFAQCVFEVRLCGTRLPPRRVYSGFIYKDVIPW